MPEQIRCPSCSAALLLPEDMLGRQVTCPNCQQTFTAELERSAGPEGIVADQPAPARERPSRPAYADDEREPRYDEDYADADRPRRGRSLGDTSSAEAAVVAPAICLMVLGGLDIVLIILNLLRTVIEIGANAGRGGVPMASNTLGSIAATAIMLIFAVSILMGGMKMRQLQSYSMAMTAAIMALLPCGNCCIIGLPIGIWALVVLNKREVKDAFS
jgi:hypothetical protein